jgi:pyruvate/2-oxoglutarate dehydrogenase complex dihydrolipoamide dehydrogenase (E3) component
LGVTVLRAEARFVGPDEAVAGGRRVRARRFVVATGSRPATPPVPGLADLPFLTNESVFDLDVLPERLLVLGGGPIGCELAQAFRRLGGEVDLVDVGPILAREDPELVAVVRGRLRAEGVRLREGVKVAAAEPGPALRLEGGEQVRGTHLLVAAGRKPEIEGLGLDLAGVAVDGKGVKVDARLRTTNARVFAIGDIAGGPQFTHLAGHHAGIVIRNALFRLPSRADRQAVPRVTYTDPELAGVGLSEAEAAADGTPHEVLRWPFADNDRARAERRTEGLIKLLVGRRGRLLGAGIAGAHAGELILPYVLALDRKLPLSALAGAIVPYPTLGEVGKRAAGSWYAKTLFGPRTRRLVRLLAKLG